jgi:uncharacterized protein
MIIMILRNFVIFLLFIGLTSSTTTQKPKPFKAIAFYTAKNDQAHISFVHEANRWFPEVVASTQPPRV